MSVEFYCCKTNSKSLLSIFNNCSLLQTDIFIAGVFFSQLFSWYVIVHLIESENVMPLSSYCKPTPNPIYHCYNGAGNSFRSVCICGLHSC